MWSQHTFTPWICHNVILDFSFMESETVFNHIEIVRAVYCECFDHTWNILSFWRIGPTKLWFGYNIYNPLVEVIQICGSQTFGGISQQLSYGTIGSTSISRSRCHLWLKAVFNASIPGFRKSCDWSAKVFWERFFIQSQSQWNKNTTHDAIFFKWLIFLNQPKAPGVPPCNRSKLDPYF